MKTLLILLLIFSSKAFAYEGQIKGKIFVGGFTFLSENYLPATLKYSVDGSDVQVSIALESDFCVIEFDPGKFDSKNTTIFNKTVETYLLPVKSSCGGNSKVFKFSIFFDESGNIVEANVAAFRRGPYFSTNY